MCGIVGIIATGIEDVSPVLRMADLVRHRGPDDEGFLIFSSSGAPRTFGGPDTGQETLASATRFAPSGTLARNEQGIPGTMAFGHRRLSIVDLSPLGHQPMCTADGRYWIVYNGEVYNHPELRETLERAGHIFHSRCDTEVILAAYAEWGVECLSRFNGMFALVIYDTVERRYFLARDRFGVKPLYWWSNGQVFLFASEIKAFRGHPAFEARANREYLGDYLDGGPQEHREETAFDGVRRLCNASYILADQQPLVSGSFQVRQWWSLNPNTDRVVYDEGAAKDIAEEYRYHLKNAVEVRLRADVRIGSALSGGLDSSSVVHLVNELLRDQGVYGIQSTFSSVYRTPGTEECDESRFIQLVTDALGVRNERIEPNPIDVPEEHRKMIWAMDTPPESTCMSGWHTFRLVSASGVVVTLDGQGADEQLAGYERYLVNWLAEHRSGRMLVAAGKVAAVHSRKSAIRALARALASRTVPTGVLGRLGYTNLATRVGNGLNVALAEDATSTLLNLIHYADRTSMAFSIESRMPFLDVRLVEFLAQVPSAYKIHDGWTKHLARQAFSEVLPREVVWRRDKLGWPIPERFWSEGPLRCWFDDMDSKGIQRCRELGFDGASTSTDIVRRIRRINLHAWCEAFI